MCILNQPSSRVNPARYLSLKSNTHTTGVSWTTQRVDCYTSTVAYTCFSANTKSVSFCMVLLQKQQISDFKDMYQIWWTKFSFSWHTVWISHRRHVQEITNITTFNRQRETVLFQRAFVLRFDDLLRLFRLWIHMLLYFCLPRLYCW